jgi:glutamine amidotransferase
MVTLVNYGLGNIQAFYNAYRRLNIPVEIASTAKELAHAKRLILPGVGSFDWAIGRLNASGLRDILDELVLGQKIPVLGVCVGMQLMADRSDEGQLSGLGWLKAEVRKLGTKGMEHTGNRALALPHMGWNQVAPVANHPLFYGLDTPHFYFLHSYYWDPSSPSQTVALTTYEIEFTSAVAEDNIIGVQFHPEKSHSWGSTLLRNFAK